MFNRKLKEEIKELRKQMLNLHEYDKSKTIELQSKFDCYVFKTKNPNGELHIKTEIRNISKVSLGYSLVYKYVINNKLKEIPLYFTDKKNISIEKYAIIPNQKNVYIGVQLRVVLGDTITKYYVISTADSKFIEINNDNKFENCEWIEVSKETK